MYQLLVIGVILIIAFFVYQSIQGNKDLNYVVQSGGLTNKYSLLIKNIIESNPKLKIDQKNPNNIRIGYNFIGDGYVWFRLIEMSGTLQVTYMVKDMVDGERSLVWNFNEYRNQNEMFDEITKGIFIENLMCKGFSKEEANVEYNRILLGNS